jgi:hypothetical protein
MANSGDCPGFVSEITALIQKSEQDPVPKRKSKIAKVFAFTTILGFAKGSFLMRANADYVLKYWLRMMSFSKAGSAFFRSIGSVTDITQHSHQQEMVSRCTSR